MGGGLVQHAHDILDRGRVCTEWCGMYFCEQGMLYLDPPLVDTERLYCGTALVPISLVVEEPGDHIE